VGIWAWQSNGVVIQNNQAFGNRSPFGGDGGGFDIDGGVTNSLVQYNTSSDNAGAGYLLAQFGFADAMQQNTFRYNLSVNDGIDDYAGITVWGENVLSRATAAVFHNNTVIVDKTVAPNSRGAVSFLNAYHDDIDFINNVFVALNGADLVDGPVALDRTEFVNNAYWTAGAPLRIGETVYASVLDWAQATQQEMLGGEFAGNEGDPLLDAEFRPLGGSPLIDAGQPAGSPAWPSWWPGVGAQDLYGTAVPQGAAVDIGAVEFGLPGDFNVDGVVDAADYVVWRKLMQDLPQYVAWKANFGRSLNPAAAFAQGRVPEPASLVLISLAILVVSTIRPCAS